MVSRQAVSPAFQALAERGGIPFPGRLDFYCAMAPARCRRKSQDRFADLPLVSSEAFHYRGGKQMLELWELTTVTPEEQ